MEYGLIGEHLPHSFSKEIHEAIGLYGYELCELGPQELDGFMRQRDFKGINVTIPYKQSVIPYLESMSEGARAIGAVNAIVNDGGKLHGHNTDFGGMEALIERMGLSLQGAKVLVLGTGGTSRTASAVARHLGAAQVQRVSRSGKEDAIDYDEAHAKWADADLIINTTPCGMFPNAGQVPVDLDRFTNLSGVVDAIYNPLCTALVLQARAKGIPAEGGLYMLVAQAVLAAGIFTGQELDHQLMDGIYADLLVRKRNVVLIGMPGSGKTTVGRRLARKLGFGFVDTDDMVEQAAGCTISHIFETQGEAAFRDMETEAVRQASQQGGQVIATGGGAVLRPQNVDWLRTNGQIFLLDRPLKHLVPTDDRPLASKREHIERLYRERMGIYRSVADQVVAIHGYPNQIANRLFKEIAGGLRP